MANPAFTKAPSYSVSSRDDDLSTNQIRRPQANSEQSSMLENYAAQSGMSRLSHAFLVVQLSIASVNTRIILSLHAFLRSTFSRVHLRFHTVQGFELAFTKLLRVAA